MNQQLLLRIQLPSIFTQKDQIEFEVIGFNFDPQNRLRQIKIQRDWLSQANIGSILEVIALEQKKAFRLYEADNWNKILRPLNPFAFEIEMKVIIKKINQPSLTMINIEDKAKKTIFEVATIQFIDKITEKQLSQLIVKTANNLIQKKSKNQHLSQKILTPLVPQKLYNPHIFIKTLPKDKYIQFYSKGIYEYYHYGDQSFNDQGWGCAYRSLQTLLSWFNLQSHCILPSMITISQIQQLIDRINLGSQHKIKNTNQWIGATEVSWVVKRLTNYDCRILHISDGKDIIEHCQVLRQHFQKVGCPVMYGGGEYAYSIVGLNYSWQLGECQFLILDPHYNGPDNLDKILQKKGLCWRKPSQMFKKGIFYNFCLPLIPQN